MIRQRNGRWWIDIHHDGQRYRESVERATGKNTLAAANALERLRLGEIANGTLVGAQGKQLRLSGLRALLASDYVDQARKSGDRVDRAWKHLTRFWRRDPKAITITTAQLHNYVDVRRDDAAAPATIRNELTALRRAFMVAVERQQLAARTVPKFPKIRVKNARNVFLTDAEVTAVRDELPAPLKNVWTVAAWTGWRRNELLGLTWDRVDLDAGVVRLDPHTTKNEDGREVPFDVVPALVEAFREQREYTSRTERATGRIVPHVFHRNGKPIKRMDVARQRACTRAGVIGPDGRPKLLHDLRRTAARRLTRAGVPQHITMRILGIKTPAIFRRYSILETDDIREGFAKVVRLSDRRKAADGRV